VKFKLTRSPQRLIILLSDIDSSTTYDNEFCENNRGLAPSIMITANKKRMPHAQVSLREFTLGSLQCVIEAC